MAVATIKSCLVTTLNSTINDSTMLKPDQFIIHCIPDSDGNTPVTYRRLYLYFRNNGDSSLTFAPWNTVTGLTFKNANEVDLGSSIIHYSDGTSTANEVDIHFPDASAPYDVIVSGKYNLERLEGSQYPNEFHPFFNIDFKDLAYCTRLVNLISMRECICGDIANLKNLQALNYLNLMWPTGKVYGDISALNSIPSLYQAKLSGTSISGDIAGIKDLNLYDIEIQGCTSLYGNLETAFKNMTNMNYFVGPCISCMPHFTGVIDNFLTDKTQLTRFQFCEENLTGSIDCLENSTTHPHKFLNYVDLAYNNRYLPIDTSDKTKVITGSIATAFGNSGSSLQYVRLSRTPVDGDIIAAFSNSSTPTTTASHPIMYYIAVDSTNVTGNVTNLNLPKLETAYLGNTNLTGNISFIDRSPGLIVLSIPTCNISGDISHLANCPAITTFSAWNNPNITGDISSLNSLTSLTSVNIGRTKITGDIGKGFQNCNKLTALYISGAENLTGNLSLLPNNLQYIEGNPTGGTYTWGTGTRPSSAYIIALNNITFSGEIDEMLIAQAKCVASPNQSYLYHRIYIRYNSNSGYQGRTSASDAAVKTLNSKGYTVWINGVLVEV